MISFRVLAGCLLETGASKDGSMTKLTKRFVEAVEPQSKDHVIWDDELPCFGLRIYPSGQRSYLVQYRAKGRSRRHTIGLHRAWTPETARR